MKDLKPKINEIDRPSTDRNVRGLSGSIWAALTPSQKLQVHNLIDNSMSPEEAEQVILSVLYRSDQQPMKDPNADSQNPLLR